MPFSRDEPDLGDRRDVSRSSPVRLTRSRSTPLDGMVQEMGLPARDWRDRVRPLADPSLADQEDPLDDVDFVEEILSDRTFVGDLEECPLEGDLQLCHESSNSHVRAMDRLGLRGAGTFDTSAESVPIDNFLVGSSPVAENSSQASGAPRGQIYHTNIRSNRQRGQVDFQRVVGAERQPSVLRTSTNQQH